MTEFLPDGTTAKHEQEKWEIVKERDRNLSNYLNAKQTITMLWVLIVFLVVVIIWLVAA